MAEADVKRSRTEEFMGIHPGDVVAFVGGGGKSVLIHSLARRLAKEGRTVLTTATRTFRPDPGDSPYTFVCLDRELAELTPNLKEHGTACVAAERLPDGGLRGFSPDELRPFAEMADYLFVEAEDSGGESLSPLPDSSRPIPPLASVLCAVAGLDAVGEDLDPRAFAERLIAPDGVLRCWPQAKWTVLCLHKADGPEARERGSRVARAVRELLEPSWTRPKILLTSVRDFFKPL